VRGHSIEVSAVNTIPTGCALCRSEKPEGQGWFVLTEDQWEDKLRIFQCSEEFAELDGVFCACSPAHVQQLVAHWVANGPLNYPFVGSGGITRRTPTRRNALTTASVTSDLHCATLLGELAVYRESLNRALLENPQCLVSILDALTSELPRGRISAKPIQETSVEDWSHVHSSLMRSGRRRYWLAVLGVERGVPFYEVFLFVREIVHRLDGI